MPSIVKMYDIQSYFDAEYMLESARESGKFFENFDNNNFVMENNEPLTTIEIKIKPLDEESYETYSTLNITDNNNSISQMCCKSEIGKYSSVEVEETNKELLDVDREIPLEMLRRKVKEEPLFNFRKNYSECVKESMTNVSPIVKIDDIQSYFDAGYMLEPAREKWKNV